MTGLAKRLSRVLQFTIIPTSPFNFDATFHKPDHYPTGDNFWEPGVKWQTMVWPAYAKTSAGKFENKVGLKFMNKGLVDKPEIAVEVYSSSNLNREYLESLREELIYRYSLSLDLTEFNQKFRDDKQLGPIVKRWKGMRPMHYSSLYEHIIVMVMLQNCTIKRSVAMHQTLFEHYGILFEYDGKGLWAFWESSDLENITEEELRSLKIGYRAKFIKRISSQFASNEVDEFHLRKLSQEEQKGKLLSLYGIGPASVNDLLWEVFEHYDKLVKISPWQQKIYSKLFFDRDPENPVSEEKLLEFFEEKYGEYQMLAVHYIWEDLWWRRQNKHIPWLNALIRL